MDAMRKEETYTVADIYALPDGQRAELIDGKTYDMDFHNIPKCVNLVILFKNRQDTDMSCL